MDSMKIALVEEWLEQINWLLDQMSENDDGEFTLAVDTLSEVKEELETL